MPAIFLLLRLALDALFSRKIVPTEETPSAHPTGPIEGNPSYGDPVPPVPVAMTAKEAAAPSIDSDAAPSVSPGSTLVPSTLDSSLPVSLVLIVAAMRRLGYKVFDRDDSDLNLNIVAVRNPEASLDKFDCEMNVFWKFQGKWTHYRWPITTFPGSRYLIEKLLSPKGAAILVPGQYLGVYALDLHGGRYRALCQRNGAVNVYRDGDRDRVFNLSPTSVQNGSFGINIHVFTTPTGSNKGATSERVYAASAGCQVFKKMADFLMFRDLCDRAAKIHGNQFSYTLITQDDLDPQIAAPVPPRPVAVSGTQWTPGVNTVGVRNKNLLNVKGEGWLYSEGRDSRGHNIFPTWAKGLRAGIITLRTYWVKHRLRSIAGILARWAPVTDTIGSLPGAPPNSPARYSAFVGERMGISPTATLRTFNDDGSIGDADQLFALVSAMVANENDASLVLPRAIFDEALSLI